jgi:hypothetical protein
MNRREAIGALGALISLPLISIEDPDNPNNWPPPDNESPYACYARVRGNNCYWWDTKQRRWELLKLP